VTLPPSHRGRRDNGLESEAFSPVADVDPRLADHLLDVLGLREVPAYVEPAPSSTPVTADRLYVAAHQTGEARAVLSEVASELGIQVARDGHRWPDPAEQSGQSGQGGQAGQGGQGGQAGQAPPDILAGRDTDAEFAAIVASMGDVDRPLYDPATSPASHAVGDTDPPDEVEHFVPPTAPPLSRPAAPTALAVITTLLGIAVIAFGGPMGLPGDAPLPLGVVLILFGTVLLILRLRPEPWDESDDDGAVV